MSSDTLFLHIPGKRDPILIKGPGEVSLKELVQRARSDGHALPNEGAFHLFEGEDEEPLPDSAINDNKRKRNQSIICHSCKRIVVRVVFNGSVKEHSFAPNRKLAGVLNWALDAFGQKGIDASGLDLQLDGHPEEELPDNTRLGSLVHSQHCELTLNLILKPRVNG